MYKTLYIVVISLLIGLTACRTVPDAQADIATVVNHASDANENRRSNRLLLRPRVDYALPADVQTALTSTTSTFGENISGTRIYTTPIVKTEYLTFATGSTLVIELDPAVKPPPFVAIAARNVFIQGPQKLNEVARVTYKLSKPLDGVFPGNGGNGTPGSPGGGHGGRGGNGPPGDHGKAFDLPPVYILFQNIEVLNPHPSVSAYLSLGFNGPDGGTGSAGGNGGRGGDGARGSDAECNEICLPIVGCTGFECRAGPGRGGDSGYPGLGGTGGNAGRGGNGANVHLFAPSSDVKTLGFMSVTNIGGKAGAAGGGGFCGVVGQEGGGGSRKCCPQDRGSGTVLQCPGPPRATAGVPTNVEGAKGDFSITARDLADIF